MNDNRLIIQNTVPIITALKKMDAEKTKLLIVGDQTHFQGLISIGDIQRAIINNIDLNSPISSILRKDIIVASVNDSQEEIKKKMLKIR